MATEFPGTTFRHDKVQWKRKVFFCESLQGEEIFPKSHAADSPLGLTVSAARSVTPLHAKSNAGQRSWDRCNLLKIRPYCRDWTPSPRGGIPEQCPCLVNKEVG